MKILFNKEGKYENLIVLPEGTHYAVTVETEDDDKQLILQTGQSRFVLESTKEICQKSRGANTALATEMFNEIVYYISRLPVGLDVLDISTIQAQVMRRYEAAWRELESCLSDWKNNNTATKQSQNNSSKAQEIFLKILELLQKKLGTTVEEWFRDADIELKDQHLYLFIQSPFCREVLKRRCLPVMQECAADLHLDINVIITAPAE